jgi:hypothetical protein
MSVTVGADGMSVVHASSNGITQAFPDTCLTPAPPAPPVPIPYPNIAKSSDTADGTSTVTCDGNPTCVEDSNFSTSNGDEPGNAPGGVASGVIQGKAEFVNYSFDVLFEGKKVARAMDLMLHNNKNTPPFPVVQGPVVAMGGDKDECYICNEPLN